MKIIEVISDEQLFNVIKDPRMIACDQMLDRIYELTHNLTVPVKMFNQDLTLEDLADLRRYKSYFEAVNIGSKEPIMERLDALISYFSS